MAATRTLPIDLVQAAVSFAERQGWDVADLLHQAGVSPLLLRDGRSRVTEQQLVDLVQAIWRSTDDELFGLSRHPLPRGTFRLLCYALLGATDLGDALDRLQGFLRALPAIPAVITVGEKTTTITLPIRVRDDADRLVVLVGLSAAHRLVSWMLRSNVDLIRVDLPFEQPADPETVALVLDGPLRYAAPQAGIVFSNSWLGSPLMRDERDVDEFVDSSPAALINPPRYRVTDSERVRRLLEKGLRTGQHLSSEQIAARLAVSQQTLRRRLADDGTSLRELSEQVRRDAAVTSLVAGVETVAELSTRLGFSEPSAFTRAFRRWTGSTPGAYRRAAEPADL